MPIICLLSAGAGKHHGRPHCLHSYPLGACLGAHVVRNRTLGSGLGCQKLSSHPPRLVRPTPSSQPHTSHLLKLTALSNVSRWQHRPGDLLEVGPGGVGTHSCLGQCQLPPSQGGRLQTWAKQGHIITTSGSRRVGKRGEIPAWKRAWHLLTGPFQMSLRMPVSFCSHFSHCSDLVHSLFGD